MTRTSSSQGYPARRAGYPALAVAAALSLVLAGCAARHGGAVPDPPTDPGLLVLRIAQAPGFSFPVNGSSPLPDLSLYGDGQVIVPAAYDGALPTARRYQLTPPAYRRLYGLAYAAGLGRSRRIDTPPAPDAPVVDISFFAGGTRHTTRVILPDEHDPVRDRIAAVRAAAKPDSWSPADVSAGPTAYRPDGIAAIATYVASAASTPQARPWPLDPLGAGTRVASGTCVAYRGDRAAQAADLARSAAPATRWASGGNAFVVVFRPLLPDEADCTSLAG